LPFCHSTFSSPRPKSSYYPNVLNTLGDHLRKRRLDLGLLQKRVAEDIGVNTLTICNWESNKSTPFIRYIPKIIRFLGYNPLPTGRTLAEKLNAARKVLGVSQKALAKSLGVDESTLRSWEAERHHPTERSSKTIQAFLRQGLKGNGPQQ
jgi:DNA-binding XRE family transcriptional regulator